MASSPAPSVLHEPALATTKRKFDALLSKLTASASTTSLATTLQHRNTSAASLSHINTSETASKRARLSGASMSDSPALSGNERIQQLKSQLFTADRENRMRTGLGVRAVGSNPTAVKLSSTTPQKAANFQPASQEHFLTRLKSFADIKKWTIKPDAVGEVAWAKRGWSCDTWNTVACKGGCEQRVAVKLRPKRKDANGKELDMSEDLANEVDEKVVEKFRELIIEGHHEDCLWRKRGCPDDIYHVAIPSRVKSTAQLLERFRSLKTLSDDLPLLENLLYPGPRVEDITRRTSKSLFSIPDVDGMEELPSTPSDSVAFLFALFGWTGIAESRMSLAVCKHCFQRTGLWLCSDSRLKEMSQKLDVPIDTLKLNLVESHREHCPWKNAEAQCNPIDGPIAGMAGWQTQEFMILGSRKTKEGRANVQSVDLGSEYTDPRHSVDSEQERPISEDKDDGLHDKWQKFKARLRRTTSRKSLQSVKSVRSTKSRRSAADGVA